MRSPLKSGESLCSGDSGAGGHYFGIGIDSCLYRVHSRRTGAKDNHFDLDDQLSLLVRAMPSKLAKTEPTDDRSWTA
ncbi:unnamed protein product [Soboliphyme baturini]|uniref:Transposase n=1 Tax=Soboliphyme baturini TaxID=241478 RepID=A0A183J1D5_9BILA|nr:unnamed protein product [Soboliphyme baturini]